MVTVSINLYSFNELDKAAKEKAIFEHQVFLNEIDAKGRTFSRREAIEAIEINEYLFFSDGELASITHYTGGHDKSGITEFKFHGQVHNITAQLINQ